MVIQWYVLSSIVYRVGLFNSFCKSFATWCKVKRRSRKTYKYLFIVLNSGVLAMVFRCILLGHLHQRQNAVGFDRSPVEFVVATIFQKKIFATQTVSLLKSQMGWKEKPNRQIIVFYPTAYMNVGFPNELTITTTTYYSLLIFPKKFIIISPIRCSEIATFT